MKRWAHLAVAGLFVFAGCKAKSGEKGDKGDVGVQGLRGPGDIEILTGTVSSDDFTITDSRIARTNQINVYVGSSAALLQLPIWNPSGSFNVIYSANITASTIEIFNAQTGMGVGSRYIVVLTL